MRVGIVGIGYVGSALAQEALLAGHSVFGVDIEPEKIRGSQLDAVEITRNYEVLSPCEIIVIAVPTPLSGDGLPDLTHLERACNSINGVVARDALIINESTSFPGTLREFIRPRIPKAQFFAAAPERIDPGNNRYQVRNIPRVVAGLDAISHQRAIRFYQSICNSVSGVKSPEIAEASKLLENTFRQINIAFINEFAKIANGLGLPTEEIIEAASTKPFGFMGFQPSLGVGGHCIPIDPIYLSYRANQFGVDTPLINISNSINAGMPHYVAAKVKEILGGLADRTIQVVGLSYKANTNDTRESPSIKLIEELRRNGARVTWHDDLVGQWNGEHSSPLENVNLGIVAVAHDNVEWEVWKRLGVKVIDVSASKNKHGDAIL